ncbi:tetratricopeptide repeat protein [Ferriphaselus sp. R-1]|uniref:tetratricopeptide repeat protein n=1 Tax=Ferriphaselus sp. R-1 TaxID=1485544 RepID=UPI00068B78D9|nr:tetratricopeptide repeat protein [Ferriphaselus sp. R-1]
MNLRHALLILSIAAMLPTVAWAGDRIRIEHRTDSPKVNSRLADAWQSLHRGELLPALEQYRAVLRLEASNHDALLGVAAVALRQGDSLLAARYFNHVLTLDPRDPSALAGLALLSHETEPESSLKLSLEQHPDSAALHFALGRVYAEQSRWSEARDAYALAQRYAPDAAVLPFDLAVCLDHLGQSQAAMASYRRALQLDVSGLALDHAAITRRLEQLAQ